MANYDFTVMPLETTIDGGTIKVCPHCGKHGLFEITYGNAFYTHIQIFRFDEGGKPETINDWCPKPKHKFPS
jgi:hypothetical protein